MPRTLYHYRDGHGLVWTIEDPDIAARLSRAGHRVTAETWGGR